MTSSSRKIPLSQFRSMQPKPPAPVPVFGPQPLPRFLKKELLYVSTYLLMATSVLGFVAALPLIKDRLSRFDNAFSAALDKEKRCPSSGETVPFTVPNGVLYSPESGTITITKSQCPSEGQRLSTFEGKTDKGEPVRASLFYRKQRQGPTP